MNKDKRPDRIIEKFWEKPLSQLSTEQWEALCDGCGRCCLKKFSDEESDELVYTRVICSYFSEETSQCGCYEERTKLVPECLNVKDMDMQSVNWMPDTCAYRLRFENKPLFPWHPLLAGSQEQMGVAGISINGKVVNEDNVHPQGFEEHIIHWVEA